MDSRDQSRHPLIHRALPLVVVAVVLHLADRTDLLSALTRPAVHAILQLVGVAASDQGSVLEVGGLHVPWTRDCAGLNSLALLLAMTLWAGREEASAGRAWWRLLATVPAAFAANVARIFTLIVYRDVFYPAVESPALHYFVGFIWLLPFLGWFVPSSDRPPAVRFLERLHLAAVLALVAPLASGPGGTVVVLATLALLAESGVPAPPARMGSGWVMAWTLGGVGIGLAGMESLWIPWLLVNPTLGRWSGGASLSRAILLLGTLPIAAMQTPVAIAVAAVLAARGWRAWRLPAALPPSFPNLLQPRSVGHASVTALAFLAPFVASSLPWRPDPGPSGPPAIGMSRRVDPATYQVRLVGQSPDIELTWLEPRGGGRHHSLAVCMRFRGVVLAEAEREPRVLTDGQRWMREFFIQEDRLLTSYRDYLGATFIPWSAPGIHLIASAPAESMSATAFAVRSAELAAPLSRAAATRDLAAASAGPVRPTFSLLATP